MSTSTIPALNTRFKIGWIVLIGLSALMTLSHLTLIFVLKEPSLFLGHAAFNLSAFLIILFPFRQGKKWAWLATWILPLVLALIGVLDAEIAPYYYGLAAVCVVGMLLTMQDFFSNR